MSQSKQEEGKKKQDKNAALGISTEGLKNLPLVVNWDTDEQKDETRQKSEVIVPSMYAPLKEDKIHLPSLQMEHRFEWSLTLFK